jgi:hypothetical protein
MRILKGVFHGSTTRRRGVLVAILFALATGPSALATPIFLKVEGIDGDVRSAGHEEWIEVQSYQWGVSRPGHEQAQADPSLGRQARQALTFRPSGWSSARN